MWDHFIFGTSYQVTTLTHSALGNPSSLQQATAQYCTNGSGLLGNSGGDILAWEKLPDLQRKSLSPSTQVSVAKFPPDWPEVEYLILDAYSGGNEDYVTGAPYTPYMYVSPAAAIVTPQSRGNVSISSARQRGPTVHQPKLAFTPSRPRTRCGSFQAHPRANGYGNSEKRDRGRRDRPWAQSPDGHGHFGRDQKEWHRGFSRFRDL